MKSSDSTGSASPNPALAADIKARALQLGFDVVGITTASPPPHVQEFLSWLEAGHHGVMSYLSRHTDRRADPASNLAGARAIIVAGLNYFTGHPDMQRSDRMARYAWGTGDYHDILGDRLRKLAGHIESAVPGALTKCYVDTGPILERDLAQRAGIGFIGKHTNLINRQRGNWLFLGSILTTLELPADAPEREYCGTCQRCITACPTRAIVAPYRLDAQLCISYLTIELKGSIPEELRTLMGGRLFGCDDCLEVCPWNRFARASAEWAFCRRDLPPLPVMLAWDEQTFRAFFAGTPVLRLKRRGWLRNVCVVLGNTGDASNLPALQKALDDPEPLVREHAHWAMEQINRRTGNGR
jgi:epoxyqueuosine reductase